MLILGIDTSCDDTSASVVEEGRRILSNVVSGQELIHRKYGGIVPELASRRHIEMIWPVVDEALKSAGAGLRDISAVAVCHGPGLIGSLLVGCSFAKAVCYSMDIPLVAVNHLEGHIFSSFLNEGSNNSADAIQMRAPEFPFISLIVSGGHTSLYRVEGFGSYRELGRSRDDAAGEAYDKVSKLLGLGYPGGPVLDRLSREGDPDAIDFPRAYLPESLDFSFSGLKTAVVNYVRAVRGQSTTHGQSAKIDSRFKIQDSGTKSKIQNPKSKIEYSGLLIPNSGLTCNIAASFQAAVVDVLVRKTEWAVGKEGVKRVTLSGGVAANSSLRNEFVRLGNEKGLDLFIPPATLCTDNAAMIASAGYHHLLNNDLAGMDLNPVAYLPL